jgi:hypothetical protein
MAGEWIPIDITLGSKPEVQELVDLTGQPVEVVVYRLLQLWGWASLNSADGTARATAARLARICGGDESFWLAVESVGWIAFSGDSVTISKWGDRFSGAAKARAVDRKRKNPAKGDTFRKVSGKIPNEGGRNLEETRTTGEERREEKRIINTNTAPSGSRSAPDSISWDSVQGWIGITDADRDAWATAYPAATLTTELAKAGEWLRSNPTKAKRTNWRKFVTGWLSRCQDGGGTRTGDPRICVGASNPPPQAKRRYWRDQFAKNMTDAEFHLAKQALPEVKSLAAALEVR